AGVAELLSEGAGAFHDHLSECPARPDAALHPDVEVRGGIDPTGNVVGDHLELLPRLWLAGEGFDAALQDADLHLLDHQRITTLGSETTPATCFMPACTWSSPSPRRSRAQRTS